MSTKIAMRAKLTEHQECTGCHCHSKEGYMIRVTALHDLYVRNAIVSLLVNILSATSPYLSTEKRWPS